jgi:hypothetical protein
MRLHGAYIVPPRASGEGGPRAARWEGRGPRRFSGDDNEAPSQTPLPPRYAWSPSPVFTGEDAGALTPAPRFSRASRQIHPFPIRPLRMRSFLSASLRQLRKRKRNADRRGEQPPHRPGAAPPRPMGWEGQLACRRPTAALAKGTYVTQGATQAMFPATRSGRCYLPSPVPVQRAPRAPVVMPADMIPKPPGNGPYPPARGHRTRSDFRNTFAKGVLHRASGGYVTTPGTNVKGIVVITVTRRRAD